MRCYPGFELAVHKGYATPAHLEALSGRARPRRSTAAPSVPCGSRLRRHRAPGKTSRRAARCHRASSICGCTPSISLIDSVVRVPELIEAVAAAGMPAVAVTDQSNLFAMVKFYRAALGRGVKPLIGVDLLVREEGERQAPSRLTLLCQSQARLPQPRAPGDAAPTSRARSAARRASSARWLRPG